MGRKAKSKAVDTSPNPFEGLSTPPPSDMGDEESDKQSSSLKKCGQANGDGTFFGGGPNTFSCSKCRAAGYPEAYANGHRSNQRKWCPLLQAQSAEDAADKQMSPDLKSMADKHMPRQTHKPVSNIPIQEHLLGNSGLTPDEIMLQLSDGTLNPQAAKLALLGLMRRSNAEDRELLQIYINNVAAAAPTEKRPTPFSILDNLQSKGKLSNLYKQALSSVLESLHKTGRQEHAQKPVINLLTGAVTVDAQADNNVQTVAMLLLTLERFRHVVVTRDFLSELELHSLLTWVHMQLANQKKLIVIERTIKALLLSMDNDHNQDLTDVIKANARGMLTDQQEIYDNSGSFQRSAPTDTDKAATAAETAKAKKAAAAAAAPDKKTYPANQHVKIAFEGINPVCCWYWTNGLNCANKIKINGVCKYAALHGTCGMPDGKGGYCMAEHKAVDHI